VWPTPARPRRVPGIPPPHAPHPSPSHFPSPSLPYHLALGGIPVSGCRRSSSPEESFPSPLFSRSSSLSLRSCPRRPCTSPGAPLLSPGAAATRPPPPARWSGLDATSLARPQRLAARWRDQPRRVAPTPRPRGTCSPVPGTRSSNPVHVALACLAFKFNLIHVLRRATIHFKFIFISVSHRTIRRVTIHFNFSLGNVLRCVTFRFKFSLISVCRRATFRVNFIFNSSVSLRALSRDDSF
jgi:hypothetical protein